ncbi:MAG: DUF4831 family protein [Rikenellaceae bacterium]
MKYIFIIVALFATLTSSAQSLPSVAVGAVQNNGTLEFVAEPTSTILVDLTLTTTNFTAGVYARYAQKYLGERAPLTSKTSTVISASELSLAPQDYNLSRDEATSSVVVTPPHLAVDRMSAEIMIPEQAAQNAATQIFANRRTYRELISGDIGEGVYGAGLESALERFEQIEAEYLSLFMGHEEVLTTTRRIPLRLSGDMTRYMIGRYDSQKGLLSAMEIEGEPVYLQITPSHVADSTYTLSGSKGTARRVYVVPNVAQCDLYVGANIVTSSFLPLYTFGSRTTVLYDPK